MINWQRYTAMFKRLELSPTDLSGQHILISGGNDGIGLEAAIHLARTNAQITIASRNAQKSKQAVEKIIKLTGNTQVNHEVLDLSCYASVKEFTARFKSKNTKLDCLINNSGVVNHQFKLSEDGIEQTLQVNYLSPILLTLSLLPLLKKGENPRIVMTSSDLHLDTTLELPKDLESNEKDYVGMYAYAKSKLMAAIVARTLALKLIPQGISAYSVHPGFVKTDIGKHDLPDTLFYQSFGYFYRFLQNLYGRKGEQGGISTAYMAISKDLENGGYYDSCEKALENPQTSDEKLGEELWKETLRLIGVNESDYLGKN